MLTYTYFSSQRKFTKPLWTFTTDLEVQSRPQALSLWARPASVCHSVFRVLRGALEVCQHSRFHGQHRYGTLEPGDGTLLRVTLARLFQRLTMTHTFKKSCKRSKIKGNLGSERYKERHMVLECSHYTLFLSLCLALTRVLQFTAGARHNKGPFFCEAT